LSTVHQDIVLTLRYLNQL